VAKQKRKQIDLEEMYGLYPSLKNLSDPVQRSKLKAWTAAFTEKPEAVEDLLQDIVKQAYAKPGRIGQRPMPEEADVDLDALIFGEYSEDPIHIALPPLVKVSGREFAKKISINRRYYQMMLLPEDHPDKYHPDMYTIKKIADAVGKPPSYFREWRILSVHNALINYLTAHPGAVTNLYKTYVESII
jgi:hypothetical protein